MLLRCLIAVYLFTLATAGVHAAPDTVIHAGRLVDVDAERLRSEVSVLIEGGRITAVEEGFVTPDGAVVIDLSGHTVLPGFMDMHGHLDGELDPPASYADIVAVAGDPLEDITVLQNVAFVIKSGDVFRAPD